ncbi:MAG: SgcJ/EcaC family oxidoreductase [Pirellulales bacterium]
MLRTLAIYGIVLAACPLVRAEPPETADTDEAAIRKAIVSYVDTFNRGDAAGIAAHWAEDGEWISPAGERFRGRQAIEKELEAYFSEAKGRQLEVEDVSIRFLAPIVAIEEGTALVTGPDLPEEATHYVAVHVKESGQWKLESVRETIDRTESPGYRHLKGLAWLVGTWVDEDAESTIRIVCKWTKNRNFFTRTFRVEMPDSEPLEGTQVIGWDPADKAIRSWLFDSAGGFAEGKWKQKGERWIVRSLQTLNSGEKASSINIITPSDSDSFTWQSTGREIDGRLLPDVGPVTVVRESE